MLAVSNVGHDESLQTHDSCPSKHSSGLSQVWIAPETDFLKIQIDFSGCNIETQFIPQSRTNA